VIDGAEQPAKATRKRKSSISRVEELLQQKERLEKEIQAAKRDIRNQARRNDARRKILLGAFLLAVEADPTTLEIGGKRFAHWLTRPDERELFNLPPLSSDSPALAATLP